MSRAGIALVASLACAGIAAPVDWGKAAEPRLVEATVDAGGGRSAAGALAISGTIGQFDAEPLQPAAGGRFALRGGFWHASNAPSPAPGGRVFRDGFEQP